VLKILDLMPDYHSFPIWKAGGEIGDVDPDVVPLPSGLKTSLRAWSNTYDNTLNQAYPPNSGLAGPAAEEAFEAEWHRPWRELQAQLGPEYKVVYYWQREGKTYE
jgi:hypothetical protein